MDRYIIPMLIEERAKEVCMTNWIDSANTPSPAELFRPYSLTELVRGNEQNLLAEFIPIVRRENVCLDLGSVERIDAAGIAALISLYRSAHECGHGFTIAYATPHVRELLTLVGLDEILLSQNVRLSSLLAPELARSAA
jgi:ABC-type transporter Mla MlaB component